MGATITATTTNPCLCCQGELPAPTECEHKLLAPELCGFEEFTDPSLPPKKFRVRTLSGTIHLGEYATSPCSDNWELNRTGSVAGSAQGDSLSFGWELSWVETSPGVGTVTQRLTKSGGFDADWNAPSGDYVWFIEFASIYSGGSFAGGFGQGSATAERTDTRTNIPLGSSWTLIFNGRHAGNGGVISFTPPNIVWVVGNGNIQKRDEWNVVQTFNAETCDASLVDNNVRYAGRGSFPLSSGGTPEAWSGFNYAPDSGFAYGAMVSKASSPQLLTYDGVANCVGSGPYYKTAGTVTDELTDEDTEEDAIDRASAAVPAWTPSLPDCQQHPAYITERGAGEFSFLAKISRVKARKSGLTIGDTYRFKIYFERKPIGGVDWIPVAVEIMDIEADADTEETPWVDVPNAVGFETRVAYATIQKL